jgi:hypothetical protein
LFRLGDPEDGNFAVLRDGDNHLQDFLATQPRKPQSIPLCFISTVAIKIKLTVKVNVSSYVCKENMEAAVSYTITAFLNGSQLQNGTGMHKKTLVLLNVESICLKTNIS